MQNKIFKVVLFVILLTLAGWQFYEENIGNGLFFIFLSAIVAFLYFKNEYILLAFLQMRKQNLAGAEKWLSKIKDYKKALHKSQYGYYHYLLGIINSQTNLNQSEAYFKKALQEGLNMGHDRALAYLSLANSSAMKGRKKEAENYIKLAKENDKQGMLDDQIKQTKQQLKKVPGYNPAQMRPQGGRRGSKFY